MNIMRVIVAVVWLTGLLPGMAQASDADDFVAANRSQQAAMLEQWAASPQAARLPLLQALQKKISIWIVKNMRLPAATVRWWRWVTQRRQKGNQRPSV
jgi:hypothetical protein